MKLTGEDMADFIRQFFSIHPDAQINSTPYPIDLYSIANFAEIIYKAGIKEGMNQEHAFWELAKIKQEIEEEIEYCPHGKRINHSCNDCDAEEHADRVHSYGE